MASVAAVYRHDNGRLTWRDNGGERNVHECLRQQCKLSVLESFVEHAHSSDLTVSREVTSSALRGIVSVLDEYVAHLTHDVKAQELIK